MVESLPLGLHVIEIGQPPQVRPEMRRGQGPLETAPSDPLSLVGPSERFESFDPCVFPIKGARDPVAMIGTGGVQSRESLLYTTRLQEPAGDPGSDFPHLPDLGVMLRNVGINIALGIGDVPQDRLDDVVPLVLGNPVFLSFPRGYPLRRRPIPAGPFRLRLVRELGGPPFQALQPFLAQGRRQNGDQIVVLAVAVPGCSLEGAVSQPQRICGTSVGPGGASDLAKVRNRCAEDGNDPPLVVLAALTGRVRQLRQSPHQLQRLGRVRFRDTPGDGLAMDFQVRRKIPALAPIEKCA